MRDRRGVTLLEILIALAIVAGPALYALDLIRESSRNARIDAERAVALQLLNDVVEIVHAGGPEGVRKAAAGGHEPIRALARTRVGFYPEDPIKRRALALCETLTVKVDLSSGAVNGLACVTVGVELERGAPVTLSRWLRTHVSNKGTRPIPD